MTNQTKMRSRNRSELLRRYENRSAELKHRHLRTDRAIRSRERFESCLKRTRELSPRQQSVFTRQVGRRLSDGIAAWYCSIHAGTVRGYRIADKVTNPHELECDCDAEKQSTKLLSVGRYAGEATCAC